MSIIQKIEAMVVLATVLSLPLLAVGESKKEALRPSTETLQPMNDGEPIQLELINQAIAELQAKGDDAQAAKS